MTDAERDPIVRRAIEEMQKLPAADAASIRRVVAAAAAARVAAADDEIVVERRTERRWSWRIAGIAAAAAFAGFALSTLRDRAQQPATFASAADTAPTAPKNLRPVTSSAAEALPVPKQFVLVAPSARSVSVVGDFNGWNASSARMSVSQSGGVWSITIPVMPGRHMYGFMVDDSVFTLDPRAQKGRDPDLGAAASVTIVGKP